MVCGPAPRLATTLSPRSGNAAKMRLMASTRSSERPREYLPQLSAKQEEDSYLKMLQRAEWSDAPEHTVRALVGAAMRVPPTIDGPRTLVDEFMGDMTLTGQTLESVVTDALRAVLITGRVGLYVDLRPRAPAGLSPPPPSTQHPQLGRASRQDGAYCGGDSRPAGRVRLC